MSEPTTVGTEFPKPKRPRVLIGVLTQESLDALQEALGAHATGVGGFFVVHESAKDSGPVHIIHFHYTDAAGFWHEGIAAEYPDNGHSVVLADVIIN
ncbi:hypothetical protein [Kibdelosporangium phytohabitans]|uniref:Uncharacterized protein n=1 Tax=Kibdelosporangium phytohabitans TaxID=860235 RepID=A0A0N9I4Z8_9PSEU|nr:hypothetical protein [Kibdelosporangium phytohabitans]ALG09723.1 hypothetical protein AOZ06_24995 [Kibdelosporangium phytohabitans]MBE1468914.1 hypothetical protein [Kibdelosporangium phytohabitans]